ncbi:retron system putative HNH endonuclease [Limnohabitans sp. Jir72]|uniref:retron system putative HNH endonuclease n=1 Tax=Limnohabitans sp. Jir72 TaxID=1977909 RepID=UPI000D385C12|nr:retron system putative HNH endonuclease [Limnohabitans sp. Jir72]PUE35105.1 TIGR02646 family protein [Limnohabitans sp. Jir72]
MRWIQKGNECAALTQWRTANAAVPQNLEYGNGGFPNEEVVAALLIEQGYLCAYTLKLICEASAHIEHVRPQTLCRKEDDAREAAQQERKRLDVAWENMVACFPSPGAPRPEYGAVKKEDWWPADDLNGFVSPLVEGCEARFRFELSGEIKVENEADAAGKNTIEKIGLNNARLQELRRQAFIEMGLHPKSKRPLSSPAKVNQLLAAWRYRNAEQKFKEFCIPLRQIALRHLAKLEGRVN